jgi:hypothetical protein
MKALRAEDVPEFFFFCLEVLFSVRAGLDFARDSLDHFDSGALQRFDLLGIIREQSHLAHPKSFEHLPGQGKVALVGFETEALVGLDGVETRILQLIRLQFRHQTNAAAFLLFVNQDARTLVPNHSQCHFKLLPAVAAQRVKHIAGEALRVNADQRRRGMNITHHQGNSFLDPRGRARTGFCAKAIDPEPAPTRGKIRGCEWLKWISAHSLIIAACSRVATTPGGFNRAP